jgi:hypothetical protein
MTMSVELLNTILFSVEDQSFRCLFNGTRKRFNDLLIEYHELEMNDETLFRPVRFREFIHSKEYKLIYE